MPGRKIKTEKKDWNHIGLECLKCDEQSPAYFQARVCEQEKVGRRQVQ